MCREERVVDPDHLRLRLLIKPDHLIRVTRTGLSQEPLPDGMVQHGLVELLRPVRNNGRPISVIWPVPRSPHCVPEGSHHSAESK
jgi:hypothetical protein